MITVDDNVNLAKEKIEAVLEGNFFFEENIENINELFPEFNMKFNQEDIDAMKKNFTGIRKYSFDKKRKYSIMKIRLDFVSNSSSSSFVMWGGLDFDINELKNHFPDVDDVDEYLWNKLGDMEFQIDYDDNRAYVGEKPTKMRDDQTLKQFKEQTFKKLQKVLPFLKDKKIEFISGISYDDGISFN